MKVVIKVIKSDKGIVEVKGNENEILADFALIYRSLRNDFEMYNIIDVILYIEKIINDKK